MQLCVNEKPLQEGKNHLCIILKLKEGKNYFCVSALLTRSKFSGCSQAETHFIVFLQNYLCPLEGRRIWFQPPSNFSVFTESSLWHNDHKGEFFYDVTFSASHFLFNYFPKGQVSVQSYSKFFLSHLNSTWSLGFCSNIFIQPFQISPAGVAYAEIVN